MGLRLGSPRKLTEAGGPFPQTRLLLCDTQSTAWVLYVDDQLRDFPGTPCKSFVTGIQLPLTGKLEAVPDGAGPGERPEKSA